MNLLTAKKLLQQCISKSVKGAIRESIAFALLTASIIWYINKFSKPLETFHLVLLGIGFTTLFVVSIFEGTLFSLKIFYDVSNGRAEKTKNYLIILGSALNSWLIFFLAFFPALHDANYIDWVTNYVPKNQVNTTLLIALCVIIINKLWTAIQLRRTLFREEESPIHFFQSLFSTVDKSYNDHLKKIGREIGINSAAIGSLAFATVNLLIYLVKNSPIDDPYSLLFLPFSFLFWFIAGMLLAAMPGALGGMISAKWFYIERMQATLTKKYAMYTGLFLGGFAGVGLCLIMIVALPSISYHINPISIFLGYGIHAIMIAILCGGLAGLRLQNQIQQVATVDE